MPLKLPLPQYTMPSEMDAPALQGPPLSYDQRIWPVLACIAYIFPPRLQPNTTSLAALTAPSARLFIGSGVVQITAPVVWSSAAHPPTPGPCPPGLPEPLDRKSTRLNSSHLGISYAVFCL